MILIVILIAILFISVLVSGVEIVKENTVYAIEAFGKFDRIMTAGLNFRIPLIEDVAEKVTLKQQNLTQAGRYHTKDTMAIDISTNIIFVVIPTSESVKKYIYSLDDREKSLATTIENSLRASIARESREDVLAKKEALVKEVWKELDTQFQQWGIKIISFQIMGVKLATTAFA